VDGAPGRLPDQSAEEAGHHDRGQQLEGDRAKSEPERPVVGRERHHRREPAQVRERIDHRGDYVQGEEDQGHQRQVAVQGGGEKPWPPGALEAKRRKHAEDDDRAEQDH
jgi:hypothetical protein